MKKIAVLTLSSLLLMSTYLLIVPVASDVIVPFEWIVRGAYAKYISLWGPELFFPNHTKIMFDEKVDEAFLEWTVLDRVGDSVLLNLTFFVHGTGWTSFTESVPDGKVDILDIATAAKAFGKQAYQWGYDYNADVAGSEDGTDYKIDILDIAFVAKAYGTTPDDPGWNSKADIAPEEERFFVGGVVHCKNLLLDIDVFSRETFLDGKPLGKTCFWADPYVDINDTIALYGGPPDEIVGIVLSFRDMAVYGFPEVTGYLVEAIQIDPFIGIAPYFDWDTGMTIRVCLQGSEPVDPDSHYSVTFLNGTTYNITRFASTRLGTELNVGSGTMCYDVYLVSTDVQLGPP